MASERNLVFHVTGCPYFSYNVTKAVQINPRTIVRHNYDALVEQHSDLVPDTPYKLKIAVPNNSGILSADVSAHTSRTSR